MFIETSSNIHGNDVSVSFERTDFIQITNLTFFYNRLSFFTNDSLKSTGRFKNLLFLSDSICNTQYYIPKIDRYSDLSTDWTLVKLNSTEKTMMLN